MRVVASQTSLLLLAAAVAGPRYAYAESTSATGSAAAASVDSDTRARCMAEHEHSQLARIKESLVEARAAALRCSQEECPALLRADCAQWFAELDREVPSVVLSVRAGTTDVSAATARIDGKPVAQALAGQPLELDPGPHFVEILRPGEPVLSRQVVLAASEKARLLVFEVPAPAPPIASAPLPLAQSTHRPVPSLTWVLSGTAIAAAGTASVLGLLAVSKRNELERAPHDGGCSPYCSDAQVAPIHHLTLGADVLFGVSIAAAAGAAASYLLRPERPFATAAWRLDLGFGSGAVNFGLRGEL